MQGLKEVTMHEVGHTLGLRHNFKASTLLTLEEMNDPEKTRETGLTASIMDYAPVNIVPAGDEAGRLLLNHHRSLRYLGDRIRLQARFPAIRRVRCRSCKKIAARSGEPGFAYATDEDTRGIDPDPYSNRFDLGKDPLEYASRQAVLVNGLMPGMVDRMTEDGDDYAKARQAFNVLLANYGRAMHFASRFVGGLDVSRSHKGDEDAPIPFQVIEPSKQREALQLLKEHVFSDEPYAVDPGLYNLLAPSRWNHWGMPTRCGVISPFTK